MPDSLYHPVSIGSSLIADGNIFLAPLAGFTDMAFRSLCAEYGADATFSEMVSAEGLARESSKTSALMERAANERLFAVQLFMNSPDPAIRALPLVTAEKPDIIDINCGCPVPKVVKTGAGAALLKSPDAIFQIVKAITNETDIPVTVKIRSGWDSSSINYLETAAAAVEGGAALITLHARTRVQGYSGHADYTHIANLKKHSAVPVFGSGDLFTPEDALRMITETGADGVMFARGAIGNPFIFTETRQLLTSGSKQQEEISRAARAEAFLRHLDMVVKVKGEALACREMRKHAGAYIKGYPGSAAVRRDIVQAAARREYYVILNRWVES
jgi:tRNA-dihydrouridine synthase B